jgi:holin (3TMs family)
MLGIDDAVAAVATIGGKIIDRLFPDPAQAADAKLKLLQMQQSGELAALTAETDLAKGQLAINQAEAASGDRFAAGWRPLIGYICGAGLAFQFVIGPMLTWGAALAGKPVAVPSLDMGTLLTLLLGMLGLGGMHMNERIKGVAK